MLVKSRAGANVPLSSSAVAGSALTVHVAVFLALGFYYTAGIVAFRAALWGAAAVQRVRHVNGVTP